MEIIELEPLKRVEKVTRIWKAAAYCRVSNEEEMNSFENQVRFYMAFINGQPDMQLAGIYADPMISGTQAENRPEFQKMIKDAEDGKIDIIYVKSVSRFARNTLTCLSYVRHLQNIGVHIVFEANNIDTRVAYSEMILTVLASFSQEESRSISENTKWGIRKRFEEGIVRWCSIYGYRKVEGEGEYIIHPEEAKTVQFIFKAYEQGASVEGIIKLLSARNIPSPNGKPTWTRAAVATLLKNEKYAGDLQVQKYYVTDHLSHKAVRNDGSEVKTYYIKNHHTPIIDHKTYERVNHIMGLKDVHKGEGVLYPFGPMLRCPRCGKTLQQKFIPVQERNKGRGWYCECGEFVIRSFFVEDAVKKAYEKIQPAQVQEKIDTAKGPVRKKAAELMMKYKSQKPSMPNVDFYWVDDLIDHIELGRHDLTAATARGGQPEDRTVSIYWKCGIKTTVLSGVTRDCDNPKHVAELLRNYETRRTST